MENCLKASNMSSQDVWKFPPVSYRTLALWGCCPTLTSLLQCQNCLPTSNATVERLFSVVGVIKTKLRNRLAIYMVEGILATQYGLKRRNKTCANMIILSSMLAKFNGSMYSFKVTEPHG